MGLRTGIFLSLARGCAAIVVRAASTRRLAVSEVPLNAVEEAPPLVILHGLLGQARNFRSWAAALAPTLESRRRCVSLDLRNHGDSFQSDSMDYNDMAADVLSTLDHLGIDEATILGHSMGGKVAMATAFAASHRVERLCVFDMAPSAYSTADGSQWKTNRAIIEAMAKLDLATLKDRRDADSKLAQAVLDPNIRAFALSNLVNVDGVLAWKCNVRAILNSLDKLALWDVHGTYEGPTLFLAGAHSRYIRSIHLPDIERAFPNYALRTVPDAGHWIHAEAPDTTVGYTRDFLDMPWPRDD